MDLWVKMEAEKYPFLLMRPKRYRGDFEFEFKGSFTAPYLAKKCFGNSLKNQEKELTLQQVHV